MQITTDKVFEDQIECMKMKNQRIFDRFQASEQDRKLAESNGSAINKRQNIQIRLKNENKPRQRRQSNPPAIRHKSYHEVSPYPNEAENINYNQLRNFNKQKKINMNNKEINDEVAYQDYFHFQQNHCNKTDHNYQNRPICNRHESSVYVSNNYKYKPSFQDYQRSTSQKLSRNSSRINQNNYQYGNGFKPMDQSVYKLDNNKTISKDINRTSNNVNLKNTNKYKLNNVRIHGDNRDCDKKLNNIPQLLQKTILDDEYIDDTLEDLEQYRLKVDMDDFTVIDPESPNPILAMPLTPWNNGTIFIESDINKPEESSTDFLNTVNERARDYLNLVNHSNMDISNIILSPREDDIRQSVSEIEKVENEKEFLSNECDATTLSIT